MLLVEWQPGNRHGAVNGGEADGALHSNHATKENSRSQSWFAGCAHHHGSGTSIDASARLNSGSDESHGALPCDFLSTDWAVLQVVKESQLVLDVVEMNDELLVIISGVVLIVVAEAAAEHLVENEDGDPGQE